MGPTCVHTCSNYCSVAQDVQVLKDRIMSKYKRIVYNLNIMRESACLVINPITVDNFATIFNCTP